ncbi:MAG: DNA polymerase III subunit delta' [Anaerolineaceae bacterium]|nr:MAG: DNA polymerase III subunit delta' [Anaerolineaceae bacterium]
MTANWNLLGHNWAVDMLRRHIATGEARHAYLFAGPGGLGRRSLALAFARALNCTNPPAPGDFCGQCRDCRQIAAKQHPDLSIVEPTIKDPDDRNALIPAQYGEIRISQIRDLQRMINLKPYQGKYRVVVGERFNQANTEASNAFLKTLEEPPAQVVLLLTTDNPESLLPTIVSRCEVLRLRPLPIEEVQRELERRGTESHQAELIAHISGGRPGYAFRLAEDQSLLEFRQQRLDDLQRLLSSSRVDKFAYAEKLAKDKDAMRQTFLVWESFWRDVFLHASKADSPLANVDRAEEIDSLAARLNMSAARQRVNEVERALQQMERNVNARLLAEVLLLNWS